MIFMDSKLYILLVFQAFWWGTAVGLASPP
jgi:hypothetical protein